MLCGRSLFRIRATKPGKVIELDRQQILSLVQTDVGSTYSASTLRIKEFLMRNGQPYSYIEIERDSDVQHLSDSFQISASEIPVTTMPVRRFSKRHGYFCGFITVLLKEDLYSFSFPRISSKRVERLFNFVVVLKLVIIHLYNHP